MMYKAFLVNKNLIGQDPHFLEGCPSCHKGDEKAKAKENAHRGVIKRPSQDLSVCAKCHGDIAQTYKNSLHYTTAGLKNGVRGRFSQEDKGIFDNKLFENSCRSCHASCGDCHVKGPVISGISIGLIREHKFVKRDEGKTCAFCHGGRVYPEFTGDYGGSPDVHYQKGMVCMDCHKKSEFHGDGTPYATRKEIKDRPACKNCHPPGQEKSEKARSAHNTHGDRLSCSACHSSAPYRNCSNCHEGRSTAKAGFILGLNPRDKKTVTTLRLIPTIRETFKGAGIIMEGYDNLPNYWDTVPHNIRKRTERTRSCEVCHVGKKDFLTREMLILNGSKANEGLVYSPQPISK